MRDSQNSNSLHAAENLNNTKDGNVLATNSTMENNLVESTSNPNASLTSASVAGKAGKKFQLKAVDVGNIYKSLKMGQ